MIRPVKSFEEVTRASLVEVQKCAALAARITQDHMASPREKCRLAAGTRSQPCREPAATQPSSAKWENTPPKKVTCIGNGCQCLRRPRCRCAPVAGRGQSSIVEAFAKGASRIFAHCFFEGKKLGEGKEPSTSHGRHMVQAQWS